MKDNFFYRCHTDKNKYIELFNKTKKTYDLFSQIKDQISAVIATSSQLLLETKGYSAMRNDLRDSDECIETLRRNQLKLSVICQPECMTCGYFISLLEFDSTIVDIGGYLHMIPDQ